MRQLACQDLAVGRFRQAWCGSVALVFAVLGMMSGAAVRAGDSAISSQNQNRVNSLDSRSASGERGERDPITSEPSLGRRHGATRIPSLIETDSGLRWAAPVIKPVEESIALVQATEDAATAPTAQAAAGMPPSTFGSVRVNSNVLGQLGSSALSALTAVTGLQALAATDAGSLLQGQTDTVVRFVSPIFSEPVQRGRRIGRLRGEGSYWIPARQDLDTFFSKIDSELVERIASIDGPYTARLGPGFAFYDVDLLQAPRFAGGYESHFRSKATYESNGDQWHARQSAWGGSYDWGFRIGYGHRGGSDYETGAHYSLPTSYKSGIADFAIGKDFTPNDHFDFQYFRLDQSDVELPGQFFDLNYLKTDSFEASYLHENGHYVDQLETEGWYNRTRFAGDNLSPGKRAQIPFLDQFDVDSFTDADTISGGYKLAASIGDSETSRVTLGSDLRFVQQQLNEFSRSSDPFIISPPNRFVNSPIPKSDYKNPGVYLEYDHTVCEALRLKSGARVDWLDYSAQRFVDVDGDGIPDDLTQLFGTSLEQTFDLWAVFLTAEYDLDEYWTLSSGFGHAMRPPTLTEMYAVGSNDNIGPFIAVLPQFAFTSVRGDPSLDPEDAWQVDIGLRAESECVRFGMTGFYSWIRDYITLDYLNPPVGSTYGFVNTDRATLAGGEMHLEYDSHSHLTWLASFSYVEGRDHTRPVNVNPVRFIAPINPSLERSFMAPNAANEEPLYAIPPLDGRVGVVIHDCCRHPRWSCKLSVRMVDAQNRIATSLGEFPTAGFSVYDVEGFWRITERATITAAIYNLTDKAYQEHLDSRRGLALPVLQPGQSFFTGMEVTF